MRAVIAAAVVAGLALASTRADAECNAPATRISPPDGAILPVDPRVYLWVPDEEWGLAHIWLQVVQDGKLVPFEAVELAHLNGIVVVRLEIETDVASPLTVHYRWGGALDPTSVTYGIAHATPPDEARLIAAEHVRDYWSCSFTDAIGLDVVGNAVAYRLEWARSPDGLAAGRRGQAWLWPDPADEATRQLAGAFDVPDQVRIGHESCRGWNIPIGALAQPRATRLVALFADGREAVIDTGMLQIAGGAVRLPEGLQPLAPATPPTTASTATPAAAAAPPLPAAIPWSALIAAAASGACTSLGIVLAVASRRRRRRALGQLAG